MPTIKDALDIIGKLTVAEQESLKTMLLSPAFVKSLNIEDFVAKERFANGRVCPLCGCIHVVRNGHRKDGTQRYVCKDCGKSFVIATNSIVSGTRKDLSVWEQYIDCMRGFNGVSTKYLNNYLVWNNLVNYAKESDMEKRNIFLTFVLATLKTAKCRDLSNRPAVPLVA